MITAKLASLTIALIVISIVGARNIKRDFQPPLQSRAELFLAAVPAGFIGMLLVLPDRVETIWLAVMSGLLSGIGYSFSLPRQWRYDQEKERRGKKRYEEQRNSGVY